MPPTACPACGATDFRHLKASSDHASVNYYRCEACGHVWTTKKGDSGQIRHITDLPVAVRKRRPAEKRTVKQRKRGTGK